MDNGLADAAQEHMDATKNFARLRENAGSRFATTIMNDGQQIQIEYRTDGSEVHTYYDKDGNKTAEGYRSADYVNQYNKKMAGTSFETTQYLKSGGYTPTIPEAVLISKYPIEASQVFANSELAKDAQSALFPNHSGNDDIADAFRHAYWSALNAKDIGSSLARNFGIAHEKVLINTNRPVITVEHVMDLLNNELGIKAGTGFQGSDEQLMQVMYNQAIQGGLFMMDLNSNVVKTKP